MYGSQMGGIQVLLCKVDYCRLILTGTRGILAIAGLLLYIKLLFLLIY